MGKRQVTIPVKGNVLQWAREYRGLDPNAAASLVGITVPELLDLESDKAEPTSKVFSSLSKAYHQSESILLLSDPPETPPLPSDYRTVRGKKARLSVETIQAIREAQEIQTYLSELADADPELVAHSNIPFYEEGADAELTAKSVRDFLDVSPERQFSWPSKEAFQKWRFRVEASGVLVFVKKFPWEECRGCALPSEGLPAIIVSSEDVEPAKTFTLFHEYAHLIRGQSGICVKADDESPEGRIERWCNDFAAALLMPKDTVLAYVERRHHSAEQRWWPLNQVRNAANKFRVSRPAMALRLQNLGLVPSDYYRKVKPELETKDRRVEKRMGGVVPKPGLRQRQKIQEVGVSGLSAILEGWKSGIVNPMEAATVLDFSLDDLLQLEGYVDVERSRLAMT